MVPTSTFYHWGREAQGLVDMESKDVKGLWSGSQMVDPFCHRSQGNAGVWAEPTQAAKVLEFLSWICFWLEDVAWSLQPPQNELIGDVTTLLTEQMGSEYLNYSEAVKQTKLAALVRSISMRQWCQRHPLCRIDTSWAVLFLVDFHQQLLEWWFLHWFILFPNLLDLLDLQALALLRHSALVRADEQNAEQVAVRQYAEFWNHFTAVINVIVCTYNI